MKLNFGQAEAERPKRKYTNHTRLERALSAQKRTGRAGLPEKEKQRRVDVILEFASKHNGENYSVSRIAEFMGLSTSYTYSAVYDLQHRGLLDKKFNQGTNPFTTEKMELDPPIQAEAPQKALKAVTAPKKDEFAQQTELLVFTFVKETRSTDLFEYLTWIEKRSK